MDSFWALHLAASAILTKSQEKALICSLGSGTSLQGKDHVAGVAVGEFPEEKYS